MNTEKEKTKQEQNRPADKQQPTKATVVVYTGGGCGEKRVDPELVLVPTQSM